MIISKKTLGVMCLLSICMNLSAEEVKETNKVMQLEKKKKTCQFHLKWKTIKKSPKHP